MLLHEFFGRDDYADRRAMVFKDNGGYIILLMADKTIMEEHKISGRSEQYAEDIAENWVLGADDFLKDFKPGGTG